MIKMIDKNLRNKKRNNVKAQVTIFIILAIAIVAVIGLIYVFRANLFKTQIPQEFEPVYSYYISCIQDETQNGAKILGETGGYIENPEFSAGSVFMPFSSQLNFLGTGVPYWYYISGNGVVKEQVPTKEKMQEQLNNYLRESLARCDFSGFREKGFEISFGDADVVSVINDNSIGVNVRQDLNIRFGNSSFSLKQSSVNVDSHLGKFYNLAQKIYSSEKQTLFLENYGVDILRLYAPVDGSEISCAPKIWSVNAVRENITQALEANIPETKIKGDYYKLAKEENKYFVTDIGQKTDVNVNFMYDRTWPMKLEVWPSDDGIMRADPVGLQEGMGMLGFCYVPYHFVYDLAYPVLVQVYLGNEMFQFPVVVSVNKNVARQALDGQALPNVVPSLCQNKLGEISVKTYNTHLDPVEANIQFRCFDTTCDIGKTTLNNNESSFLGPIPQCVNGFIIAKADGYETNKYQTSVGENNIVLIMNKKYKLNLSVSKSGVGADSAIVVFSKNNSDSGITLSYPDQKEVDLTEGQYQVKVYIYSNTSINLKGSSTQKCVDVPKSGILGFFGSTDQKCFTIDVPDQTITYAIAGGGTQKYYFSQSELENSRNINLDTQSFAVPRTVFDLQANYNSLDIAGLNINLK
jgi:hypothetical protein